MKGDTVRIRTVDVTKAFGRTGALRDRKSTR